MKILLIQLGRIGDMILISAAAKAIKDKYPSASIDIIASAHNYQIAQTSELIDKTYIYTKKPCDTLKLIWALRREHYDYYIDVKDHYSTESKIFAKLAKADKKIGFNANPAKPTFDYPIKSSAENENSHFIESAINTLAPLSIYFNGNRPCLFESQNSAEHTKAFLTENNIGKFIPLNISTFSEIRRWQIEKWTRLVKEIAERHYTPILVCTPHEKPLADEIIQNAHCGLIFPSRSILDAISLYSRAELIISPDTSVVHIASAFDAPIIALFGTNRTPLIRFRPLSSRQKIICPENGSLISDIEFEQVKNALNAMLAE